MGHLIWLCWGKEVGEELLIIFAHKILPIVLVNLSFSKLKILLMLLGGAFEADK